MDGRVLLLQTVTLRQRNHFSPFCSKCTRQSCVHWLAYKKIKEEEEEFAFNHHVQEDGTNDSFHDDIIEHEHNVSDQGSIEEDADEEEVTLPKDLHWRTLPPIDVYH